MKALTEKQVADFQRDGFLFPFPLLSETERQECLQGLARYEDWLGERVNATDELRWRTMTYLFLPWVARLAQDPRILDRVEDLLGPDIMVWTGTFFIKEANSLTIADWHQDSTYHGTEPGGSIAAWIALTDASAAAGCMDVLSFNGEPKLMRHEAHVVQNSVNRAGQRITEAFDESRAVSMPLKAGEFSFHHGLCMHRSGPNTTDHRRIGLAFNYIRPDFRPVGKFKTCAMLVRGEDRYNNFERVEPAKSEFDEDALAVQKHAVDVYRETYREQEPLHAPKFG